MGAGPLEPAARAELRRPRPTRRTRRVERSIDQARRWAARGVARRRADRHARRPAPARGAQGAGQRAQHRRRRIADRDRDGGRAARRRDDGDRARRPGLAGRFPAVDVGGAGRCGPSCWSARRAPRRSRGRARRRWAGSSRSRGPAIRDRRARRRGSHARCELPRSGALTAVQALTAPPPHRERPAVRAVERSSEDGVGRGGRDPKRPPRPLP